MSKHNLKSLIHRLIDIEPDNSPIISCFVNLEHPRSTYYSEIEMKARAVSGQLAGQRLYDYEDALAEIRDYLENSLKRNSKGAAIYSRWGEKPVLVPIQFEVPVESDFIVDSVPHIYPLIQLKDTYHRFVIVISTEEEARIIETTFGSITEEIIKNREELRVRAGREWSREHYRNHRDERRQQHIREKIRIIEELVSKGGHNHLVLAGSPKMVAQLKKALPPRLEQILVSTVSKNPRGGLDPILFDAIQQFMAAEQQESLTHVELLETAILSGGLGVGGYEASCRALREGYADLLIIDQEYPEVSAREDLVRLATAHSVRIETVKDSEVLSQFGGAGCLLRYRPYPTLMEGLALKSVA